MMHDRILHNPTHEQVVELFNFDVVESPVFATRNGQPFVIPEWKAMVTSDTDQVLGIHKSGFHGYGYKRLDEDASKIVNNADTVRKGAGLLYDRGVAFVQIGMPESVKSRSGVLFDPFLLGTTSFNGKFKTAWKNGKIIVICRNTHAAAYKAGVGVSAKHTKGAEITLAIENIQDALGILHGMTETEADYIDRLCDVTVSDSQFEAFLAKLIPSDADAAPGRTETMRANKRDALWQLFQTDVRCQPDHTAWSVLQATNTFNHHLARQRGADDREVRNMEKVVNNDFSQDDAHSLHVLERVLNRELVAA